MTDVKIGKILRIEGLSLLIQITEDVSDRLLIHDDCSDFLVSINRLVYSKLPSGKIVIAKIAKIFDKSLFVKEDLFRVPEGKYLLDAKLIGIYDNYLKHFDSGINTFPIIGSEVYAVNNVIYNTVLEISSKYKLEIAESYHNRNIKIFANPDILLGKHLAIIGNTGTGKTCTVASIIQGLKRRLNQENKIKPKILIFDSNKEYERAFKSPEFKVKCIKKEEIKLPHYYLNYHEYYKFVGASQGVQAPVLKEAIASLRNGQIKFDFAQLPETIIEIIREKAQNNNFNYNQWYGWVSTMLNRIQQLIDDERFDSIIQATDTDLEEMLSGDDEILIFETDFDRDVLDVVMFLFCKILYKWTQDNESRKNILLILEEAHRYINEDESDDYKLGNYYIERIAREGRKFGLSLVVSSQRPSELSKTILSQCNSFIIHRITNRLDLEFITKLLTIDDKDLLNIIPGLEKQYAVITGEAFGYSDITRILTAEPTPKSDDPKVIDSWMESE
ncbi:MAG: ATP-binding protein [Nitrospirae bacterium]|nr:ATP-binding protein [Nitrospirota bacterium]